MSSCLLPKAINYRFFIARRSLHPSLVKDITARMGRLKLSHLAAPDRIALPEHNLFLPAQYRLQIMFQFILFLLRLFICFFKLSLVQNYSTGLKKHRNGQAKKIEAALHTPGKELIVVEL